MKKMLLLVTATCLLFAVSGCSSAIKTTRPVETQATIGIVPFADCHTGQFTDCAGSGQKVAEAYGKALGAPVISKDDSSKFDVLLTGEILEYNIATPMLFRPNMVAVNLRLVAKDGTIVVTQNDVEAENNLFGSTESCNKKLAEKLKSGIGR